MRMSEVNPSCVIAVSTSRMDEPLPFTEIDRCLLIHDNRHEDEGASDIELVLYFWPHHVDLSNQIALLGACSWVKAFSQSFTGSPVRVFEMKRFKLAMRQIGNVNLVLTAGLNYSRKSLETQLDHVVQAFYFYNLSPDNIEARAKARIGPDLAAEETERGVISPLRQAIITEYQEAGSLLVPMIQSFHNGLAKNFHPLQYSRHLGTYPGTGNISTSRLLAKASSVIWAGVAMDEFISGCAVDHEGNVICTHVDIETTRWLCNFLQTDESSRCTEMVVYMSYSKVEKLLVEKREFFRAKNDLGDRSTDMAQEERKKDELIPVRLLFVHRPLVTLCMLASMQCQPFNAFHRLDSLLGELSALEISIQRIHKIEIETTPQPEIPSGPSGPISVLSSPIRTNSGGAISSAPATPPVGAAGVYAGSPILAVSARTVARGLPTPPRSESGGSFHPPLKISSGTGPSGGGGGNSARGQSYNYLSFSDVTQIQEGAIGVRRPDAEKVFFENLSFVHDTFNETPQISKIVYRDQQGTMFCRKLFGKETYFQQLPAGTVKFSQFEERARETLASEHSVFLI